MDAFVGELGLPQVLAGFWIRVWASIIDIIWLIILIYALGIAIYGTRYLDSEKHLLGPADAVINYLLPVVLDVWFWMKKGATPGKMICGIRIVSVDGSPLTIGRCVIRSLGYYVSLLPLCVGYLWAAWDLRNQTWHDKMARTLVVRPR